MAEKIQQYPWKDGYWYNKNMSAYINVVKGNECAMKSLLCIDHPDLSTMSNGTWTFGDFGDASEDIAKATGIKRYNMEMKNIFFTQHGVLNKSGTILHTVGFSKEMEVLEWVNEMLLWKLKIDRDPAYAPPITYFEPTPDKPGKFIWLSGRLFLVF